MTPAELEKQKAWDEETIHRVRITDQERLWLERDVEKELAESDLEAKDAAK